MVLAVRRTIPEHSHLEPLLSPAVNLSTDMIANGMKNPVHSGPLDRKNTEKTLENQDGSRRFFLTLYVDARVDAQGRRGI
jgi:hypothetical protein